MVSRGREARLLPGFLAKGFAFTMGLFACRVTKMETASIQPPFAQIYKAPNLIIEAISGSTRSPLNQHPELQVSIVQHGNLEVEWLTETGRRFRKRISGPAICVTPGLQSHALQWSDGVRGFVVGVGPDLFGDCAGANEIQETYGLHDPF